MILKRNRPINKISKRKNIKRKSTIKTLNKVRKNENRYINDIIEKRYYFIIFIICLFFIIISVRLFNLQIVHKEEYLVRLANATEKQIESSSAPRGRIYDRNHKLLVDNKAIKTIYYKKQNGVTMEKEIKLAYKISDIIDIEYDKLNNYGIKNFWYLNNLDRAKKKIKDDEWDKYEKRKLDDSDIKDLIFDRITSKDLNEFDDKDKKAAYIYYLMNKGYSYSENIIKNEDVTEEEYAYISENIDSLGGFNTKLDWERVYLYDNVFKSILGTVSSNTQGIPSELVDYYVDKGYSLDDRVGISYLEYQYEEYLKGTKAKYKLLSDNSYELVSEGKRGNDIVLTIDIDLQKSLEEILEREVLNAKGDANTNYYNRSFVVINDPNTGEILAMSGKQVKIDDDGNKYIVDYTPGVVTTPVTPGSVVKGASMLVGYKYGAIDIGTKMYDECIKIKDTPEKCSWKPLGNINDIDALRFSSNYYQYKIAISVGEGNYKENQALSINNSAFDKYRDMYASFGLGVKTGIDLPVESLGYSGKSKLPGHLLDFSIGQYDNYTPIQLSQYISTLANGGTRLKPYLLKEVYSPSINNEEMFGEIIYKAEKEKQGKVDIDEKYINRVKEGFNRVVIDGLGYGYMGDYTLSSGKTGTSQSFIDTDGNGVVDTETITSSFVGYSPSNNPKMSIVVVSPDISTAGSSYTSPVTKRISSQIVNKFFEIYK